MAAISDGGPAFPVRFVDEHGVHCKCGRCNESGQEVVEEASGLSIRDYFAGQALAGLTSGWPAAAGIETNLAQKAYQIADAMLAARAEGRS